MNQHVGTIAIKHTLAWLLIMSLEDENHDFKNFDNAGLKGPHKNLPKPVSGQEAKWMRDLMPLLDPKIHDLLNGFRTTPVAASGSTVNEALLQQTLENLRAILHALSDQHDANASYVAERGELAFWDPNCYPHGTIWRVRETLAALLG